MKGTSQILVSIVLPNRNGRNLLKKNLPSVIAASPEAQIIVTDDASTDGSVEFIEKEFPNVFVVKGSSQVGFAGNVNHGVKAATGDIVVLLNTDVSPKKGYLTELL